MRRRKIIFLKGSLLAIGIVVLFACLLVLPWLAQSAALHNPEYAYLRIPVLMGIYITTIPFVLALYQAYRLLHDIDNDNAFSNYASTSLVTIRKCSFMIMILYVIGMLVLAILQALHPGIAIIGLVIIFTTLVIAVFADVLHDLLLRALEIKIENDLTV